MLIHVPERDAVLPRLVAALKPGGLLIVEEDDTYPITSTAEGAYLAAWQAFIAMTEEAGLDPEWARSVPRRLDGLGLIDVGAEVDVQFFRGGSEPARFWNLTWLQARERVLALGFRPRSSTTAAPPSRTRRVVPGAKVIAWGAAAQSR